MTTRVVIADDQAIVRSGLRVLVARDPGITVVGEAATGKQAVEVAHALRPDVMLMDIRMPGIDGIQATREILRDPTTAGTRIIVLTTFDSDENVFDALHVGASGFLLKDTEPDELRRAVQVVAAGDALLSPSVTRRLIRAYVRQPTARSVPSVAKAGLTERETEVLILVANGMSNDDIADHLVISRTTAKTHVSRAMTKLGVHDRAQLVIAAYQSGLAQPACGRDQPQ